MRHLHQDGQSLADVTVLVYGLLCVCRPISNYINVDNDDHD